MPAFADWFSTIACIGYLVALFSITVAIAVSFYSVRILRCYEKSDNLSHSYRKTLARRYARWRLVAHFTAAFALIPLVLTLFKIVDSVVYNLISAFGVVGAVACGIFALRQLKRLPILEAFRADVSVWNEILLSASGLAITGIVYLCWIVCHQPGAFKEAIKIIFELN